MRALPERTVCLVTDIDRAGGRSAMLRIVKESVRGGVNMVQVRAHELDEASFQRFAQAVVQEANGAAMVVVNGSLDIVKASSADGIHFREQNDYSRKNIDANLIIGQSVHSLHMARRAEASGASYLIMGTVFPSASHPGGGTIGAKTITAATKEVKIPVIGIGGITSQNASEVIKAGAAGVAVIGAIIGADNPFKAAQDLVLTVGIG